MYSFKSRVRYSEVAQDGKLSIPSMINYLQDCSTFQSEMLGRGVEYLQEKHSAWLLAGWTIDILRLPKMCEEIEISTWAYSFRSVYGYRNFCIKDMQGEYLVKADSLWFCFDTRKQLPRKVDMEDVEVYMNGEAALDMRKREVSIKEEMLSLEPITVSFHHLDTNAHVNNAMYIEIAMESFKESIDFSQLDIQYKKMAMLGDIIYPKMLEKGKDIFFSLNDEHGSPYALIRFGKR